MNIVVDVNGVTLFLGHIVSWKHSLNRSSTGDIADKLFGIKSNLGSHLLTILIIICVI